MKKSYMCAKRNIENRKINFHSYQKLFKIKFQKLSVSVNKSKSHNAVFCNVIWDCKLLFKILKITLFLFFINAVLQTYFIC